MQLRKLLLPGLLSVTLLSGCSLFGICTVRGMRGCLGAG